MGKDIVLVEAFSGIGGFSKGFTDAGFNITKCYFSEIDKHAIANYKYNFPDAEYIGSITDVSGSEIRRKHPTEKIVFTFGFPCTDVSIAGKRKGFESGTRSSLLFDAGRVIMECKPEIFVAENVKGLYSIHEGRGFYEVLRFLTFFGTDSPQYTVESQLFNTNVVLPQNRERVYFIGHLGSGGARRVLPVTEDDFGVVKGSGQTTTVRTITGGGQFRGDAQQYDVNSCVNDRGIIRDTSISTCLDSNYYKGMDNHAQRTMVKYNEKV